MFGLVPLAVVGMDRVGVVGRHAGAAGQLRQELRARAAAGLRQPFENVLEQRSGRTGGALGADLLVVEQGDDCRRVLGGRVAGDGLDGSPARDLIVESPGGQQRLIGAEDLWGSAVEQTQLPSGDLNGGAVERADREGTIQREFHVPGAARLRTRKGNLLGDIRCGHDQLRQRDAVVGHKADPQQTSCDRIGFNRLSHRNNELDDELCHRIAGRGFSSEQEGSRQGVRWRS